MDLSPQIQAVLHQYPLECFPTQVQALGAAGGFSGAQFWKLQTPRGTLALRRWPREHPSRERLEFIQAVLWHVHQEGFDRAPLPIETRLLAGYVHADDFFWELAPWLPGQADYRCAPSPARLAAALRCLAQFHVAAASFPLPEPLGIPSPGIQERIDRVGSLLAGGLRTLAARIDRAGRSQPETVNAELLERARHWLGLFPIAVPRVLPLLEHAATLPVALQPCIRDIWHDHVLFEGERVSGIIDFGALRAENVTTDVARLLGSLVEDDTAGWEQGLTTYREVRPLSPSEEALIKAFDQSSVLLSGSSWLEWIFVDGRQFENTAAIIARLDQNLRRLRHLATSNHLG